MDLIGNYIGQMGMTAPGDNRNQNWGQILLQWIVK